MDLKIERKDRIIEIVTIFIMILAMILFEIGYCNTAWLTGTDKTYNISICRIVFYLIFLIIYIIFKNKFSKVAEQTLENKMKRRLVYTLSIILFFSVIIGICIMVQETYVIRKVTVFIITLLLGYLFVLYVSNNPIKNVIVIACTFGVLFSFTTDFNNQIDEKKHFMSAFNISFFNFDYVNNPITDEKIEELPQMLKIDKIDSFLEERYKPEITKNVDKEDVYSTPSDYIPLVYVCPALGMTVARLLGGSIIDIYIIGRIFNLILYTILIVIALKLIPFKKNIIIVLAMMPLMLLLSATYSIDGYCVGITFIFISYCLKLFKEKETLSLKEFLILCGLFVLVLLGKKMAYILVGTIIIMLPIIKTIKKNKKYLPIIITVAVIAVIIIVAFIIYIKSGITGDPRGNGYVNPDEQIQNMLNDPIFDIMLIINQIKRTIFSFDWWGMLHYYILFTKEATCVALPLLLFILYVSLTEDDYNFSKKNKLIMFIAFMLVYGMTSLILYISYTKVGGAFIIGYQTRYILPVLPLVLFSLSSNKVKYPDKTNRIMNVAMGSGLFLFLGMLQLISL